MKTLDWSLDQAYQCQAPLNLYKTEACDSLVTQAARDRYLRFLDPAPQGDPPAVRVMLLEDDYPGWLPMAALGQLQVAATAYCPPSWSTEAIDAHLPAVLDYAEAARQQPNVYLWGGTLGPDYDCSGLVQAAFASVGIWLPRDAYQQEAFAISIPLSAAQPGNLLFFGTATTTTHVALYLGDGTYLHSSGPAQGRNGLGLDSLMDLSDPISHAYALQLRGAGKITRSYQPCGVPLLRI